MKLSRLHIRRLPGIAPGFEVDGFDPGANFITGPNAIGKSSLVRALRYLLRESRSDDPNDLSLSAEFVDGQNRWSVHREGKSAPTWERDGRPAEPPALPTADAIASHLVTIEDLVQIEGRDERTLASTLRRELNGGFDLQAIRNTAFPRQPRIGQAEKRALDQARSELRRIEQEHADLHRQQQTLPELAENIRQAEAAGHEVERLQAAQALVQARQHHDSLERQVNNFPAGMERLGGRELTELESIEQRIQRHEQQAQQHRHELKEARQRLTDSGLAESCPDESELEMARDRLNELKGLDEQIAQCQETLAIVRAQSDSARARLGVRPDEAASLPRLDESALDRARELARSLGQAERARDEYTQLLNDAEQQQTDGEDPEALRRGTDLLRDWLAAPAAQTRTTGWKPAAMIGGLGAATAIMGGLTGPVWLAILGGLLMLAAILLPRFMRGSGGSDRTPADGYREQFLALGLTGPERWQRNEILQHLNQLDTRLARVRVEQERIQHIKQWQQQRQQAEQALIELERQRQAMADELGFDPALLRRPDDFLQRVNHWHRSIDEITNAQTRLDTLESRADSLTRLIQEFLGQYPGLPSPLPAHRDELATALRKLRERSQQARDAQRIIDDSKAALNRLTESLETETSARARLYRDAGLVDGQRRELEQRLEQLAEWRSLQQEMAQARNKLEDSMAALELRPDLVALAQSGNRDEIDQQLRQAGERHARLDQYKTRRTEIERDIHHTETRHDREAALATLEARQGALAQRRDEVLDAETAHFLLDEIESEYRNERQPPVLRSAREHFARFTHHQWELALDESEQGSFRARDTQQNRWRQPAELSTATRMQLLLALRLAHAEASEQAPDGHRATLPLIIDEALTTSDHERATVILENLNQLARQGRQILYLAAMDAEYQLWQHATGQAPKRIDLGEIRRQAPSESAPGFQLPAPIIIPPPEGRDATDYGQLLNVPAIDPRQASGNVHLFHLLHDQLDLLHRLLADWRIRTLGQLETLLNTEAGRYAIPDEALRDRLDQRCRVTREWINAWRIGHGKPINRSVLEQADGITPSTIDRVSAKADEVGHDAAALIRALEAGEVERYRADQRAKLEEYLIEHGYLDRREALNGEQRRDRLVRQLAGPIDIGELHGQVDWLEATSTPGSRE